MRNMNDYLAQVKQLISSCSKVFTQSEMAEIEHLIDHDELAEGLRTMAWIIHDENKSVDRSIVESIFALTEGLVLEEHLPPNFRNYANVDI